MKIFLLVLLFLSVQFSANSQSVVIITDSSFKAARYCTTYTIKDAKIEGDNLHLKVSVPKITPINYCDREKILYAFDKVQKNKIPQIPVRLFISGDGRDLLSSVFADYDLSFNIKSLRQKGTNSVLLVLNRWEGELMYRY